MPGSIVFPYCLFWHSIVFRMECFEFRISFSDRPRFVQRTVDEGIRLTQKCRFLSNSIINELGQSLDRTRLTLVSRWMRPRPITETFVRFENRLGRIQQGAKLRSRSILRALCDSVVNINPVNPVNPVQNNLRQSA
jgi:hypothetical protein